MERTDHGIWLSPQPNQWPDQPLAGHCKQSYFTKWSKSGGLAARHLRFLVEIGCLAVQQAGVLSRFITCSNSCVHDNC